MKTCLISERANVATAVGVAVGLAVGVAVGVPPGVAVATGGGVGAAVAVGVALARAVGVGEFVTDPIGVAVGEGVAVATGDAVVPGSGAGPAVVPPAHPVTAAAAQTQTPNNRARRKSMVSSLGSTREFGYRRVRGNTPRPERRHLLTRAPSLSIKPA